jgi:excinuclease UvrABC nuclease subunit
MIFKKPTPNPNEKGFYVYKGLDKKTKELIYIGTTIQKPSDRFRWHKHNGKDLEFHVIKKCDNEKQMLDLEFSLIKEHKPKLNHITHRKQTFNKVLSNEDVKLRVGNSEWCQCCLKRRVNKGYEFCYYCSK